MPQVGAASFSPPHERSQPSTPRGVKFRPSIALLHMGRESAYSNGAAVPDRDGEFASEGSRIARDLCQDAAAQHTSLLLEQWASMLLGAFWERRELAHRCTGADAMAVVGDPFLTSIARVGSAGAKLALLALSRIDRGELGPRARELADGLRWPVPPLVQEVGTARLVRAFVASSPRDGEAILFRSDGVGPCGHTLAVYIDERYRGIAKHVALLRPELAETTDHRLKFRHADLATTCRKVARAITQTDTAPDPPVDESFSRYRAIALARLSPLDG